MVIHLEESNYLNSDKFVAANKKAWKLSNKKYIHSNTLDLEQKSLCLKKKPSDPWKCHPFLINVSNLLGLEISS